MQYIHQAHALKLSESYYWHLLLHMKNGTSEIDDSRFFLASNGKTNAKSELDATIHAFLEETRFDNNATACKYPARKAWLVKKLKLKNLPKVECKAYQKILHKLDPQSVTIVFPSAHINSPASMFGHTFLRINSSYNSKLLSYAINYAANVDETKTNGFMFAIHGLTGGYKGLYSMLPYYEKLKEYSDSEQRDIWEYNLNLTQNEVYRMFRHIWELNGIYSDYYFFTENCSYNLLWLLEIANNNIHLRDYFTYHVSPLETVHAMVSEGIVTQENFRPSKRTRLLKYEEVIDNNYLHQVRMLAYENMKPIKILEQKNISIRQKQYILEAAIELLEYSYMQGEIDKNSYLSTFHELTVSRATLGMGNTFSYKNVISPLLSHRQARVTLGVDFQEGVKKLLFGVRPVYHDTEDNANGLLRGTQIEFLNILLGLDRKISIEKLTLLSISSLSQISEFIKPFSWRTHFQWDKEYLDNNLAFNVSIGTGASWGNTYGYTYVLTDASLYLKSKVVGVTGVSAGLIIDKSKYFKTNIEATQRWYSNGYKQLLFKFVQSYSVTHNTQLKFEYFYKNNGQYFGKQKEYKLLFNYYF